MTFDVRFTAAADEDLERLFDFLLDHAATVDDLALAQAAIEAVRSAALMQLATTPYSFRKIAKSQTRRERIIPFGATGYIALYEITSPSSVLVLAVRHQREEDFH